MNQAIKRSATVNMVIMINCEKCNAWFHDECLGFTEYDINNIKQFYCSECLNNNHELFITYNKSPILTNPNGIYCYCKDSEYGQMVECGKCNDWFHHECIELTEQEIRLLQVFFCTNCLQTHNNLNLMFKDEFDYIKEHTKPLFNNNNILSVYNLYPYHMLLELYKILKFRVPYCMFDLFVDTSMSRHSRGLTIPGPVTRLNFQRKTFLYQSILCWNQHYKKLVNPFTIILHSSCQINRDTSLIKTTNYDFSTSVSTFKLKLKKLLHEIQMNGTAPGWERTNTLLHKL